MKNVPSIRGYAWLHKQSDISKGIGHAQPACEDCQYNCATDEQIFICLLEMQHDGSLTHHMGA
jgi:hypothetical protein